MIATRYRLDAKPGPPPRDAVCNAVNRLVRDRTGALLSDLRVDVAPDPASDRQYSVVLTGRCGTFYCKQLAGVAAMAAAPGGVVRNRIAVV